MRSIALLLLLASFTSASVFSKTRRHTVGLRKRLDVPHARVQLTRSPQKRALPYVAGPLRIEGFATRVSGARAAKKRGVVLDLSVPEDLMVKRSGGSGSAARPGGSGHASKPSADSSTSADGNECEDTSDDNGSKSVGSDPNGTPSATHSASLSEATSSVKSSVKGQTYDGTATYYLQGGNAGACGSVAQDSDKVVALFTGIYYNGANCGRMIKITNESGTSIEAKIADLCPSCSDNSHIDLSQGAYDALGSESAGVLKVTWGFIS